jgi:hypothetical protein
LRQPRKVRNVVDAAIDFKAVSSKSVFASSFTS